MESLPPKPSYPGEDTRPTSKKEIWGWYSYGWAAEVFVVCGVGSFIPITLEQLARERGVLLSDGVTPCSSNFQPPAPPGFNATSMSFNHVQNNELAIHGQLGTTTTIATSAATAAANAAGKAANQCIIYFLGRPINTASFAMYTFSFSVFVQALLIISMSGAADHGRFRKLLLLIFAFTGSIATMLFLPITSELYYFGSLLAIISNTGFGASFVLLNSFLPLLVRNHPEIRHGRAAARSNKSSGPESSDTSDDEDQEGLNADSTSGLLANERLISPEPDDGLHSNASNQRQFDNEDDTTTPLPRSTATASPQLQLSTKISSTGIGIGYIAAVIVQIVSVLMVKATGSSTFSLRLVLFLVGAWWFVFTIPSAMYLRPRPGPPLPGAADKRSVSLSSSPPPRLAAVRTVAAYISSSWVSLWRTFQRARRLKDVLLFLSAWFLLSDAIATVSGTAVLFAKTTLNMSPAALALINVVVMLSGVVGAFLWPRLSAYMRLTPSHTILISLALFELIPLYALLGYIPAVQRLGFLGLQRAWEMYLLGLIYGLVLGGLSSYCRAVFGDLIPPGSEAAFYALYAITDKGSSVFGPAVVGAITDAYGEIRPAFLFLAILIAAPWPLMAAVNVERGRRAGRALSKELRLGQEAAAAGRGGYSAVYGDMPEGEDANASASVLWRASVDGGRPSISVERAEQRGLQSSRRSGPAGTTVSGSSDSGGGGVH